jgi:hypothetical protein
VKQEGLVSFATNKLAQLHAAGTATPVLVEQLQHSIASAQAAISTDESSITPLGDKFGKLWGQLDAATQPAPSPSNALVVPPGSSGAGVSGLGVAGLSTAFALVGAAVGWKGRERRGQYPMAKSSQEMQTLESQSGPSYSSMQ